MSDPEGKTDVPREPRHFRFWRAKRTSRWLTKVSKPGLLAWAEAAWHVELVLPTGPSANYPMSSI
jgi:hypothetical protein